MVCVFFFSGQKEIEREGRPELYSQLLPPLTPPTRLAQMRNGALFAHAGTCRLGSLTRNRPRSRKVRVGRRVLA